ncbi:hypothetical protein VI06_20960 [Aquitalea magnusonii]|nr:hypothetical protein VI06_20960 [Aquitalea magnusonii]
MPEDNSITVGKAVGEQAKYQLDIPASARDGMPEGLGRVLDILHKNIPPRQQERQEPPKTGNKPTIEPETD